MQFTYIIMCITTTRSRELYPVGTEGGSGPHSSEEAIRKMLSVWEAGALLSDPASFPWLLMLSCSDTLCPLSHVTVQLAHQ